MNSVTLLSRRSAAAAQQCLRPGPAAARLAIAGQRRFAGSLPTIAQSGFWKSIVPKPFRRGADGTLPIRRAASDMRASKEWNPATFYIFFFLFVGSMAIQMITLKRDFHNYMRRSEVRIGLLREVVERIQRGEDVDVERVLGTGDPAHEAEWTADIENDGAFKAKQEEQETAKHAEQEKTKHAEQEKTKAAAPESVSSTTSNATSTANASITSFY